MILVIDFGKYLKNGLEAEKEMKYVMRCRKDFSYKVQENHNLLVSMAFIIMILIIAMVLFLGVRYFIQRKGRKLLRNKLQHNLVTLSETFQFFFVFTIFELFLAILLNVLEEQGVEG